MTKILACDEYSINIVPAHSRLRLRAKKNFQWKNLHGWTVHGTEKWNVEDKELVCESGPDKAYGYLSTNKPYKNFELTMKFKQEANGKGEYSFAHLSKGSK